jgi:hypothetical protein
VAFGAAVVERQTVAPAAPGADAAKKPVSRFRAAREAAAAAAAEQQRQQ